MKYRITQCCHHCRKWNVLAPDDRLLGRFHTRTEAQQYADMHIANEREMHADYQRLLDLYAMRGQQ